MVWLPNASILESTPVFRVPPLARMDSFAQGAQHICRVYSRCKSLGFRRVLKNVGHYWTNSVDPDHCRPVICKPPSPS